MIVNCQCGCQTFSLHYLPKTGMIAVCVSCGKDQPLNDDTPDEIEVRYEPDDQQQ